MDKILLVNDCKFESIIIRDMLKDLGYEVEISNEYEAINYVKLFKPKAVIINLIMKETTGDKLIEKIKDAEVDTTCIVSSCGDINIQQFEHEKVDGVMHTPVDKWELEALLKKILQKKPQTLHKEELKPSLAFCKYCGGNIKDLGEKVRFCPYCGERL